MTRCPLVPLSADSQKVEQVCPNREFVGVAPRINDQRGLPRLFAVDAAEINGIACRSPWVLMVFAARAGQGLGKTTLPCQLAKPPTREYPVRYLRNILV